MRWRVEYADLHGRPQTATAEDENDADLLAQYLSRAGCDPVTYYQDDCPNAVLYGYGITLGLVAAFLALVWAW